MRFILSVLILSLLILNVRKKERVIYVPVDIPGSQMAATIPPFGIFIEEEYRDEGNGPGSILAHERIHWKQYKEMGLVRFHFRYLSEYIINGRINHSMEEEARRLSK